jgi:DNA-directed RNA polymerase specialized sigma24 family protein
MLGGSDAMSTYQTAIPAGDGLRQVLTNLQPHDRDVVSHLYLRRNSPAQTAAALGVSVEEVHRRACRAVKAMRTCFQELGLVG